MAPVWTLNRDSFVFAQMDIPANIVRFVTTFVNPTHARILGHAPKCKMDSSACVQMVSPVNSANPQQDIVIQILVSMVAVARRFRMTSHVPAQRASTESAASHVIVSAGRTHVEMAVPATRRSLALCVLARLHLLVCFASLRWTGAIVDPV